MLIILKFLSYQLTQLKSLQNNRAGFQWKVFSIGRTNKIQVDCSMSIKRVTIESTSSTETTTDELTTTELITTVQTTASTSQNETILVLNSYSGWKPAMVINSTTGDQEELSCFTRGDDEEWGGTEAFGSCSVNWQNQLFIFGGDSQRRQISRLTGHMLQAIGSLSFDHSSGTCSSMSNQYIFVCFNFRDADDHQRCRRSTGPLEEFSEVSLSAHPHAFSVTSCSDSES